jgi:DNA-binding response OmpR family regulator
MPYSVLVVDQHPRVLARIVEPLRGAGYDVIGATTFEAAKIRLSSDHPPNLLIAASRLGPFNGLHLVLRARMDHPEMAVILTALVKDPLLEAEACSYGASCVVSPETPLELLALVSRTFASQLMSASNNYPAKTAD